MSPPIQPRSLVTKVVGVGPPTENSGFLVEKEWSQVMSPERWAEKVGVRGGIGF